EPLVVGREVNVLADVGTVEEQRVAPFSALYNIAPVARVPPESVEIGRAAGRDVVLVAVDGVVAFAAGQRVAAAPAADHVVAVAAVDRHLLDGVRLGLGCVNGVVAGERVDRQEGVGGLGRADRYESRESGDLDAARAA